jgi:hypothetical protein
VDLPPQRRKQLLFGEVQEAFLLVAADLDQGEVGEAGLLELAHALDDRVDVRPAGDRTGDVVLPDELRGPGEPGRPGQLGVDLPAAGEPAELLVRTLHGGVAVGAPRHRHLPDLPGRRAELGRVPLARQLRLRLDGDHRVGHRGEPLDRLRAGHRDTDRRPLLRQVPQLRRIDAEVLALVVEVPAVEQAADDLQGFGEHVVPDVRRRPAAADDVLVEVLTRPETEGEPPARERLHRRRLLRHDRRVVAHGRAGHVGHQLGAVGDLRDRAQHAPGVGRVPLFGQPRRVVVAHDLEVEAGLFRTGGVPDQLVRPGLLGHQRVTDPHRRLLSGRAPLTRSPAWVIQTTVGALIAAAHRPEVTFTR